VLQVRRAEHRLRLDVEIGPVDARDFHRGGQHAFAVAQRNRIAHSELLGELLSHVERNRHRPDHSARQPHVREHAAVIGLVEKALERRERAVQQHLDVAELPHIEIPRWQVACTGLLFLHSRFVEVKILQHPAVGIFQRTHSLCSRLNCDMRSAAKQRSFASARLRYMTSRPTAALPSLGSSPR
jgi:hypothetical protein